MQGVVYITDETSRHEITSWRMDDTLLSPPLVAEDGEGGGGMAHVVFVVDMSGSMRKGDVPGYSSRTEAVYECLAEDLVVPQLKAGGADVEVGGLHLVLHSLFHSVCGGGRRGEWGKGGGASLSSSEVDALSVRLVCTHSGGEVAALLQLVQALWWFGCSM